MLTVIENARIVIALLKAHNIRHIVISPGGSNIPIVQGVQDDPFFKCYSVVDERSAMYVAIGLYLQTGEVIATSCTSAQATRNYIPGLTEAFYRHVPILAITTSKHPKFVGQEYMQCPVQTSLPVDAVKHSYSLPIIQSDNDRQLCVRMVNEAILELTHHTTGPVQLNIEVLDTETWSLEDITLPDNVRVIKRYTIGDDVTAICLKGKRVMFVIGEHMPFTISETNAIDNFCASNDAMVYASHISNFHGKYALNVLPVMFGASPVLFSDYLCPDVIITIGGITGDYDLYFKLTNQLKDTTEVWRVNPDGNVVDTYSRLTKVFQMSVEYFCSLFSISGYNTEHLYYANWKSALQQTQCNIVDFPLSNVYVAQQLHALLPSDSCIHFAILNSFRSWLCYDLDDSISAFCNVGGFGIDGCLSTMLGQSFATDNTCFLITGDLSFYYDMNAIAIRHIRSNVRILIINNNGGAEFKINNIHNQTDVSRYIAADGHFSDAKAWAEANNFTYLSAYTKAECLENLPAFVSPYKKGDISQKPIILEVFTTPENEKKALEILRKSCRCWSPEECLHREKRARQKEAISHIIGAKGMQVIKNLLK